MKTIYKYPIEITDKQNVELPEGAHILSVALQHRKLCLWAMIDTDIKNEVGTTFREVRIFGTGHPVELDGNWQFVGTILEETFVWHVFIEAQ